jgi:hypothetical protein
MLTSMDTIRKSWPFTIEEIHSTPHAIQSRSGGRAARNVLFDFAHFVRARLLEAQVLRRFNQGLTLHCGPFVALDRERTVDSDQFDGEKDESS